MSARIVIVESKPQEVKKPERAKRNAWKKSPEYLKLKHIEETKGFSNSFIYRTSGGIINTKKDWEKFQYLIKFEFSLYDEWEKQIESFWILEEIFPEEIALMIANKVGRFVFH